MLENYSNIAKNINIEKDSEDENNKLLKSGFSIITKNNKIIDELNKKNNIMVTKTNDTKIVKLRVSNKVVNSL